MSARLLFNDSPDAPPCEADAGLPDTQIAESNHQVANSLALIAALVRMQATEIAKAGQHLSAAAAGLQMQEAASRILTVARLHRLLVDASNHPAVDLCRYLEDVATAVLGCVSRAGAVGFTQTFSPTVGIRADLALRVGFIVGELITNAVKYSHPTGVYGRIELRCHQRPDGMIFIQVADDGVGLPENFDTEQDGGLGMRLVRMSARQLGAIVAFEPLGTGLAVSLLIPRPADALA